jgi:UDP-N-acetylglucosamine diphosphorylase / glucose-1-phosphate thymidylyltransferase / UDP-N-acetylgalactosamine diphosphorylase / glucosamine-1-phosphate N-acetyltransferase / galactosamine-1-phosphate N-acetyltransferase
MKAVILAAGKGTRMRELTAEVPKPMLPVQGKPILQHIIEGLVAAGVTDVCVIVGWKKEVIQDHFGDGSAFGAKVEYVVQEVQDGTGKAPELAKDFVGDDSLLLTYGDILVKGETYADMVKRYGEGDFGGLVTVTKGEDVTKGGILLFDQDFNLNSLVEKPSAEQIAELKEKGLLKDGDPAWYNAGIYIFDNVLFEFTAKLEKSPRGEYELTDAITALVDNNHTIAGLEIAGRWVDVRDPEVLESLQD